MRILIIATAVVWGLGAVGLGPVYGQMEEGEREWVESQTEEAVAEEVVAEQQVGEVVAALPPLTEADVSKILQFAHEELAKQGCVPMFLNEERAYIRARCEDGSYRLLQLGELIQQVREVKRDAALEEAGDTPAVITGEVPPAERP